MRKISKIALAIALLFSSALVITSCVEKGKKPNNTPINKKVDDKKPEISTPDKKQDTKDPEKKDTKEPEKKDGKETGKKDNKEPEKQDGKEPDKGDTKPKKDTEEHKKTDSEEATPKKDTEEHKKTDSEETTPDKEIQGDQPVDPKKQDPKLPTEEVKPSELKEVEVKLSSYYYGEVKFTFEIPDSLLNKASNKLPSNKDVLKKYYMGQLLFNGQPVNEDYFGLKIENNEITFFNTPYPENYNDELVLKKGTIFKTYDLDNKEIIELGKTSKDLKLRYNGEEYVVSDTALPEQKANDLDVKQEEAVVSSENKEGVKIEVGFLPEGTSGTISANLQNKDNEITVEVLNNTIIVKTTKKPTQDYSNMLIIKLNDTDIRKVVTIKILKVEEKENLTEQPQNNGNQDSHITPNPKKPDAENGNENTEGSTSNSSQPNGTPSKPGLDNEPMPNNGNGQTDPNSENTLPDAEKEKETPEG